MDDSTRASDPGCITLSQTKLAALEPWLYWYRGLRAITRRPAPGQRFWRTRVREQLQYGDSRAALVLSTDPLLVAAYTDELDCSVVLRFPDQLTVEYELEPGRRLLSVNTYVRGDRLAEDLRLGPGHLGRYVNVHPMIAQFLTDDLSRPERRLAGIDAGEWRRAERCAQEYLEANRGGVRDGLPTRASLPAAPT